MSEQDIKNSTINYQNMSLNGKITVSDESSLNGNLSVAGDVSMNSNLKVGGNVTINKKLFVSELEATNFSITGTMTYINVSQLDISDNLIRLNKNGATSAGSGIEIETAGNTIGAFIKLDNTNKWTIMSPGQNQDYIVTKSRVDIMDVSLIEVRSRLGQYSYDLTNTTSIDRNVILSNSSSRVTVLGDASLNSRLSVSSDVSFNSRLFVNGITTFNNDLSLNMDIFVGLDASLNSKLFVRGDVSMNSNLTVGGNTSFNLLPTYVGQENPSFVNSSFTTKSYVDSALQTGGGSVLLTSNNVWSGTNYYTNDVSLNSKLFVTSDVSFTSNLFVGGSIFNPTFTGVPSAPTAAAKTSTTQIATTAFVVGEIDALINSAPGALNTLNELAIALGSDASFSTTVTNSLTTKAPINNPTFTGTVGGITSSMVGLGNVNNTSDADKPVSTATTTALNLKANLAGPTFTGTVGGITSSMVGLGNVNNTSDADKPVSTATTTALALKSNIAGPTFTGTVSVGTNAKLFTDGANDTVLQNSNNTGFLYLKAGTAGNVGLSVNLAGNVGIKGSPGLYALTVTGTAAATNFSSTSDYRIKENVKLLDGTFTVDVLKPVSYNNVLTKAPDIGFIAHEVQEHYPYLVTGEKDGVNNQSLNYIGLIGILTKEVQDLKKRVAELENKK